MKKLHRLLALVMALATVFSLTVSGYAAEVTEETETPDTAATEETAEEAETPDAAEEEAEEETAPEEPAPEDAEETPAEETEAAAEEVSAEEEPAADPDEGVMTAADYWDSGTCGDNASWRLTKDGTMTITGSGAIEADSDTWRDHEDDVTALIISSGITEIEDHAFSDFDSVTQAELPNTLTTIGYYSFSSCDSLETINLPSSLTSLDDGAFSSCKSLLSITIPSKVTSIGVYEFHDCSSLSSVTLSYGLKEIKSGAFYSCTSLKTITIPSSVTSIGTNAFQYAGLTSITIPGSVTSLGKMVFYYCTSLASAKLSCAIDEIPYGLFSGCSSLTELSIPGSVASIGGYAIPRTLKTVRIPSAVEDIYSYAFGNDADLTDVYYEGSEQEWSQITIATGNKALSNATIHFNSYTPEKYTLSTPTLTSAENINGGVKLTWSAVTGAEKYRIYRKVSGGSWSSLAATTSTSYTDKTVSSGTNYTYTVRAVKGSTISGYDKTGLTIRYLSAPTITKTTNRHAGIYLEWKSTSGANGYNIYRSTLSGSTWSSYTRVGVVKGSSSTSFTDTSVQAKGGVTYKYRVVAYYGSYKSVYRVSDVIVRLDTPSFTTLKQTSSGVQIKWTTVTGANGYNIYRKSGSGSYVKLGYVKGKTSYTDTGVKGKTGTYTYKIEAFRSSSKSAYNTKSITLK